jgi:aspartyl protease family protein
MKFGPFIAIVIGFGALVGWMAPAPSEMSSLASPGKTAQSDAQMNALQRDQWLAGEVVLPREPDGHFYADVIVSGVSAHMLVDTGATTVALTGEDAEAMGLSWSDSDVRPVAQGANGPVYGVAVMLDHVQLGELEATGVEAIVVPEGLGISLLGQSFLSKIQRVEMDQDRMVLGG